MSGLAGNGPTRQAWQQLHCVVWTAECLDGSVGSTTAKAANKDVYACCVVAAPASSGDTKRLQDLEVKMMGSCSAPSGFAFMSLPGEWKSTAQQ